MTMLRRIMPIVVLFAARVGATPGWGGDCDLHVTGIGELAKTPWNLDGLFINCGSQSGAPWGASTNYCLSTGNQNYLVQMQYCPTGAFGCGSQKQNWTTAGWAITGFNASSKLDAERAVFAKCTTDECQKAATPEHLSGTGWMVSTDQGGTFEPVPLAVNTSCCDSTAASCGERPGHQACNVKDCEAKYTSFWSCLAASAVGCCQAFGWIDQGVCLCKNTRPSCKPLNAIDTYSDSSAWPHENFPLPWKINAGQLN